MLHNEVMLNASPRLRRAGLAAAILAAAALGAYVPARRASLLDPNTILRQD